MVNVTRPPARGAGRPRGTATRTKHRDPEVPKFAQVVGVDFSGAARSGKTAWIAELGQIRPPPEPPAVAGSRPEASPIRGVATSDSAPHLLPQPQLTLRSLNPLGRLTGDDRREAVCGYLVDRVLGSNETLWGFDFPFGLPVELRLGGWADQLRAIRRFDGGAREYGLGLVERTRQLVGGMHVRRQTDRETKTPFDCYHYRIIYQTFHGMRDVLGPISGDAATAVIPFRYDSVRDARRVVAEACPSSTLKRLGLPHRLYKQSGGRAPEATQRRNRQAILKGISRWVTFSPHRRRVMMSDPGGDAIDAVLAGLGCWLGVRDADHATISEHPRYPAEGFVYCGGEG